MKYKEEIFPGRYSDEELEVTMFPDNILFGYFMECANMASIEISNQEARRMAQWILDNTEADDE